jgi:HK97 family phage major capsid protein
MNLNENDEQLAATIKEQVAEVFIEKTKGLISEKGLKDAISELKSDNKSQIQELNLELETYSEIVKEQGATISQLKATQTSTNKKMSFGEQVEKSLISHSNEIALLETNHKPFSFQVKAVGDMLTAAYTTGAVGITAYDNEFGAAVRRRAMIQDVIRRRRFAGAYVSWADYANNEGGAGTQTEGGAKTQADFELVESTMKMQTLNSYITVSRQALADVPYIVDSINTELMDLVNLRVEDQVLTGVGTGTNLKGIQTYATAWTATGYLVDLVISPTIYDVVVNGIAQVAAANHYPTHVIMNPIDVAKMLSTSRATDGVYLNPSFVAQGSSLVGRIGYIQGVEILSTNACSANKLYVIDANKCNFAVREEMNITMGLNSDNFTKNLVTILAEMRCAHYMHSTHATSAVYASSITQAIADLLKP